MGQGDDAVFFALPIPDGDGLVLKVTILDPQTNAFHQAQARAIEQLGHEFMGSTQVVDEVQHFVAGKDGGEALGTFGGGEEDRFNFFSVKDVTGEEDGAEGLMLGGGGDISFLSEVSE